MIIHYRFQVTKAYQGLDLKKKSENGWKSISECFLYDRVKETFPQTFSFFSNVELVNSNFCVNKITDFVPTTNNSVL